MIGTAGALVAALFLSFDNRHLLLHVEGDLPERKPTLCAAESHEEAVTIRIWNKHGYSSSGGSGAIIGSDGERALILSCDHIWWKTDSRGRVVSYDNVGKVDLWGHGWDSPGYVAARYPKHDLSLIVGKAHPNMPVARIHIREATAGDTVTLTGFGGDDNLVARVGSARNNKRAAAWSRQGDSGGPAFVDGMIVGVLWGVDGSGDSHFIPTRHIYRLGQPVDRSVAGNEIYQRKEGVELTGLIGRWLFGPKNGKFKGKGRCPPGGCSPFAPPGVPSPPPQQNPGQPWYAPGYGPDDKRPENGPRPAPGPPMPDPDPGKVPPEKPIISDQGGSVQIDLSGFVQRPEFDALSGRVDGLASKADIEIVIDRVGGLQQSVNTSLTQISERVGGLERDAREPKPKVRHYVVVADKNNRDLWQGLLSQVDTAREAGVAINTVDSNEMGGIVRTPQLIEYIGFTPGNRSYGSETVSIMLRRLASRDG